MVSKVKQVLLAIAIAVIFAFFVGYGINTFYPEPEYEDYCGNDNYIRPMMDSKASCEDAGGEWNEFLDKKNSPTDEMSCKVITQKNGEYELSCTKIDEDTENGWCNYTPPCQKQFDNDREKYNRNVFIIAIVLGLIGLGVGAVFLGVESVGSGLMGGSVLTIIYGTLRYWGDASDSLRFVMLGIVFGALVWLGYTKLNPTQDNTKKTAQKSKKKKRR